MTVTALHIALHIGLHADAIDYAAARTTAHIREQL
jgi:hypothetical protein